MINHFVAHAIHIEVMCCVNSACSPHTHTVMPVSPCVFSMQYDCDHSIRILVLDPDGDRVRCRMANGSECLSVCDALPGVTLDEVGSTWSIWLLSQSSRSTITIAADWTINLNYVCLCVCSCLSNLAICLGWCETVDMIVAIARFLLQLAFFCLFKIFIHLFIYLFIYF